MSHPMRPIPVLATAAVLFPLASACSPASPPPVAALATTAPEQVVAPAPADGPNGATAEAEPSTAPGDEAVAAPAAAGNDGLAAGAGAPTEAPPAGEAALAQAANDEPGFGMDLLTHSAGATVHSVTSEYNSGTLALFLLDGVLDPSWMANTDETAPQHAVYELAAEAVVTHVGSGVHADADWSLGQSVEVALAATPDGPWTTLATLTNQPGRVDTRALPSPATGRYVRVTLPARPSVDAPSVLVGEVVLGGTFVAPPATADFGGAWNGGWLTGPFRLHQDGVRLLGCFEDGRQLEGTVDGRVAVLRYATPEGWAVAGELVLSSAEEHPYSLQFGESPDAPPVQAYGLANRIDSVDCRIEGVDPSEAPAADPLETSLAETGKALVYDILFDFDRATLRPESGAVLDRIAAILGEHPDWSLLVEGHTDDVGGVEYNRRLSEQRAAATVAALVSRGVDAGRLRSAGVGEGRPVADNATAGGRARNRRVELVRETP